METTFMTIHKLSPEANICYASDSITDILGWQPEEVVGRSCFDYFHPDQIPFAKNIHERTLLLDKAASLHYAHIRNRENEWVMCECVFTVVYNVLVACTSIYRGDARNHLRAAQAPAIRRLFASSPRDPRYHMLEHLSSKFRSPPQSSLFEPRAALFLNRFTENLTILYATDTVESILGVPKELLEGKMFYECIQEDCLPGAVRVLQSAKGNDSIAYLRFWRRDPRHDAECEEEQMREASQSSDSEDGGVELTDRMDIDQPSGVSNSPGQGSSRALGVAEADGNQEESPDRHNFSRTSSGESEGVAKDASRAIFDSAQTSRSSTSSLPGPSRDRRSASAAAPRGEEEPYEIEAVVSCTSDGLLVVLRRARPLLPEFARPFNPNIGNGFFAAPWGVDPVQPHAFRPDPNNPFRHGFNAPVPVGGPPQEQLFESVREIAVFAWSLVGINGNMAEYAHGVPLGEAVPPLGRPIWDPEAQPVQDWAGPENQAVQRWAERHNGPNDGNRAPTFPFRRQGESS